MSNQISLFKVQYLLKKQETTLYKKSAQSKKKIDEENKTLHFLKNCLVEYREKFKLQQESSISSYRYQRFCRFIAQLENAINQQALTLKKLNDAHSHLLMEYGTVKNKIDQIQKLIDLEKKSISYINNRKENQAATDLFNQIKPQK